MAEGWLRFFFQQQTIHTHSPTPPLFPRAFVPSPSINLLLLLFLLLLHLLNVVNGGTSMALVVVPFVLYRVSVCIVPAQQTTNIDYDEDKKDASLSLCPTMYTAAGNLFIFVIEEAPSLHKMAK